jgi:hypothetical protein
VQISSFKLSKIDSVHLANLDKDQNKGISSNVRIYHVLDLMNTSKIMNVKLVHMAQFSVEKMENKKYVKI